ncbi:hypothetical protein D3C74_392620 [compost metagenome]
MEQKLLLCDFTCDAQMHLGLRVVKSVIGRILNNRLKNQLNHGVVIQRPGNIDLQDKPSGIAAAQQFNIIADIQQLLLHGCSPGQITCAVTQELA